MRHDPEYATFNSAYINEKIGFHLQNAFLDEPTEDSLLRMLSHIGHMRDPRARRDMVPDEVWEMMPPDPEIEALREERASLKGGQYRIKGTEHEERIRELGKLIATKEASAYDALGLGCDAAVELGCVEGHQSGLALVSVLRTAGPWCLRVGDGVVESRRAAC